MRIAVPRETASGERRGGLVPESCKKLIQSGYQISVEAGAGGSARFFEAAYRDVGVQIVGDASTLVGNGDLILKVGAPSIESSRDEVASMRSGAIYVGSLMPL